MSHSSSPSPNPWSILKWLAIAISPPLATLLPSIQLLVQNNHWLTIILIGIYEIGLFAVYFFAKIWKHLEDPWAKQLAELFDQWVHSVISGYGRYYRRYFRYAHQDLDVKGMSTQGAYTLELEHVFVDLRVDPKPFHKASANIVPGLVYLPTELQTGSHSVWKYLQASKRLVLLGAPGSGKTTLVKHMGLQLVRQKKLRHLKHFSHLYPILLFLREHSKAVVDIAEYSLVQAIQTQLRSWGRPTPSGWIEQHLTRGHCLILFDGLDEVADRAQRQQVVTWVEQQMVTYADNYFVITSRPHGYRSNPLTRVTVLEAQPFTFGQIKQFLNNWYLENEIKSATRDDPGVRMRAQIEARDLLQRLREREALIELAVNPLLLTMIATVHRYRGSLPGARITLYKEICEVLLGKRQDARGIVQDLREDQRQLVLQPLAYHMMILGIRELPMQDVEKVITPALQQVSMVITPADFLQNVENSSGLLLERELGMYGFAHLTFQEYLTAVYIREKGLERELITHMEESWWHETIRLYCAQADATPFLMACLTKATFSVEALTVALECLEEARNVEAKVREQFHSLMAQGIEDRDLERRRIIAEAKLSQRLHQMCPLDERTSIDTSLVTHAEYQLFLDEQRAQGKYYQPQHWEDFSFSQGTGHKPVLGVRQSDAQEFCVWLTTRSKVLCSYRLPYIEEWKQHSKSFPQVEREKVGVWAEDLYQLIWSKGQITYDLTEQLENIFSHDHISIFDLRQELVLALNHNPDHDLNLNLSPTDRDFVRACALIRALIDNAIAAVKHVDDHDLTLISALANSLDRNLAFALALDLDRDLSLSLSRDLSVDPLHGRDLAHTLVSALARNHNRDLIHDRALINAMAIYAILFLIQERSIGKIPVYESILLVKERKEI